MTCMNRLAQSRRKERQTRPTILGTVPTGLAPKESASLMAGLEAFVNTGDSPDEYQKMSKQWPAFWPGDSQSAWNAHEHAAFIEYRDKLRALWGGSLNEHQRLGTVAYLLGLITSEEVNSLWFSGPEALAELLFRRPNRPSRHGALSTSVILPLWGTVAVRFFARGHFEKALWVL